MKKSYYYIGVTMLLLALFFACKSDDDSPIANTDDDDYVPINITIEADAGETFQDESLFISVFENDTNIPTDGTVTISAMGTGSVEVVDINDTPANLLDDVLQYTASTTYTETDSFEYTVCDAEGLSCASGQVSIKIFKPIEINLGELPYPKLSDYNFFYGELFDLELVPTVIPYEPISTLFTDYAHKQRFVWMPKGVAANYVSDGDILNFPESTILGKTFYYDNVLPSNTTKRIETRLLIKKGGEWMFADYIWDEAQQEALLDTEGYGQNVPIEWVHEGETKSITYRIPSASECLICHKSYKLPTPIGPKPQNLNGDYEYGDGTTNQLQKWIEAGYLSNSLPGSIQTVINWEDTSEDIELRLRSYVDINCAHCHVDGGHCGARELRLAFRESTIYENLGVCVTPDMTIPGYDETTLVVPGDAESSIMLYRVATSEEEFRMPMVGRSIAHDEFVALLTDWINSLDVTCD